MDSWWLLPLIIKDGESIGNTGSETGQKMVILRKKWRARRQKMGSTGACFRIN
jgi:hypothetical protein